MGLFIMILLFAILFPVFRLTFRIIGKLLGVVFSLFGYLLLGFLGTALFGITVFVLPVALVFGLFTLLLPAA